MTTYMCLVNYSTSGMANLVSNPQDRAEAISKAVNKMGGKLIGLWFAFGNSDVVTVLEMPDAKSMAALAMAISAGGAVSKFETTVLMSSKDAMESMKIASKTGYKPAKG